MLSTCLSPGVFNMVCELGFEIQDNIDILNIVSKDNKVCWDTICDKVCHLSSDQRLDYAESVRQLGPLCEAVHSYFLSMPNEKYEEAFTVFFQWTNNSKLFHSALPVLKSLDGTNISLLLMKITSCLERALGDMNVLRIFLGSPESLNLRNILWHGFASPHEIPHKYCSVLLLMTAGLGQILQDHLSNTGASLFHRPYVAFHNAEEMQVFPELGEDVLSVSESLLEESRLVLANMVPFWKEGIAAFRQGRYADSAVLILPQLETGLRLIFTTTNNCPNRMLTAESNILYTTFDEILAKELNDSSNNNVPKTLGESAMEFLWDFLNHQDGPRVRDHLSHGEIQLSEFPKQIANDLLGFSIVLIYRHLMVDHTSKEIGVLHSLIDIIDLYKSRFHPIALLQKQVLECIDSLQKWCLLPVPPIDDMNDKKELDEEKDVSTAVNSEIVQILSLFHRQGVIGISTDDLDTWLQTEKWFSSAKELSSQKMSSLYCHRWVIEVMSILRKVTTQCLLVSTNIISISQLRYDQWINKTLRSRQRQNYRKLLSSIKVLSCGVRLILTLIVISFHNIHNIPKRTPIEYQKYLKYLKSILKYAENVSIYTNQDNNKWSEAIQLTSRIILKVRLFNEGQI
ncbi:endoplasmic reticulum membrane-associated RNA degradation protein isoform X2 [Hyperolius riggenbachi]|uniref:endoplasmic reticulum membrane-associated RNA degradation protein isoform X2 n=1 Tax=Hyperolius riggenbachi TaxID=752182 RepID=UPI0035A3AA3B